MYFLFDAVCRSWQRRSSELCLYFISGKYCFQLILGKHSLITNLFSIWHTKYIIPNTTKINKKNHERPAFFQGKPVMRKAFPCHDVLTSQQLWKACFVFCRRVLRPALHQWYLYRWGIQHTTLPQALPHQYEMPFHFWGHKGSANPYLIWRIWIRTRDPGGVSSCNIHCRAYHFTKTYRKGKYQIWISTMTVRRRRKPNETNMINDG